MTLAQIKIGIFDANSHNENDRHIHQIIHQQSKISTLSFCPEVILNGCKANETLQSGPI